MHSGSSESPRPRTSTARWIHTAKPNPQAPARLYCLPFAGSGASIFNGWGDHLPDLEVCSVQLPGRERRISEALLRRLKALLEELEPALGEHLDPRPFAFLGHSMGARIAFELAHRRSANGARGPDRLFLSGARAPHLPRSSPPLHTLSDHLLFQRLTEFGGTPPELLANRELMQLALPIFRADFELLETSDVSPGSPLSCPTTIFHGAQDEEISGDPRAWERHVSGELRIRAVPGDHFFLTKRPGRFLSLLREEVGLWLRGTGRH